MKTRVLFMGTAEIAVPSLQALLRHESVELVAVVTQPDRPQGRKLQLKPSAVKAAALAAELPVLQPERVRTADSLDQVRGLKPDLIVVMAYGQILPQSLLEIPRFECLNLHTSVLPKYRGAAPIQWALLNGDVETGVTLMRMDAGMDTGPIIAIRRTVITPEDTGESLYQRLSELAAQLLIESLPGWLSGTLLAMPQPTEGACHARKIEKLDGWLDWTLPSRVLANKVRGLVPWPGAFFYRGGVERAVIKVWESRPETETFGGEPGEVLSADCGGVVVRCGEGALRVLSLQREGGKRLGVREFLAGNPMARGEKLPNVSLATSGEDSLNAR